MKFSELFLNRFLYKDTSQNLETKDSSFVSADSTPAEAAGIPSGGAAQDINTGNVQINGAQLEPGTIPQTTLDVSNWGWGQTCAFSSTDLDTVSWGAGTFKSADGTSYSISAGNTGAMSAKTYIYLSLLDSETVYQTTTTPSTAVGIGKVLVAVANPDTVSATYNLSEATQIVGDNILANSINASKITTGQLIVGTNVGLGTAFAASSAGDLATLDLVETAQLGTTVIVGGYIKTSLLTADNIQAGTLTVNSSVGVEVKDGGDIIFYSSAYPGGGGFSQVVFNETSVANKGWEMFFNASGGGGYNEGDLTFLPMSSNASSVVRFGVASDPCHIIAHGNITGSYITGSRLYVDSTHYLYYNSTRWEVNTGSIYTPGDLMAAGATSCALLSLISSNTNPSGEGQIRHYVNGAVHQFRAFVDDSWVVASIDLTAV